uniref:Cadherin domain-containing protein n=1 Tax=Pundamilia nyererei TaxID=303518 RepID=A0A3B4GS00_9CICH
SSGPNQFDITAKDKGNPQMDGHCGIEIKILDINDNNPEIIVTSLTSPVPEDSAVGTVIALISAKDPDSGDNGKVLLTLSPKSPFKLNPSVSNHYSLVTNGRLDREKNAQYRVKISASDSGNPALTSEKIILVELSDVNDNPPIFSKPSYLIYVKENHPPGKILCSVSATDPDAGENAKYSLGVHTPPSVVSLFYIDTVSGDIYLKQQLDHETQTSYRIDISATDKGFPKMEGRCTVQVDVLDVNDNAPEIVLTSKSTSVPEDSRSGTVVALLSVRDLDSGDNGKVTLQLPKTSPFTLKPSFSNNYALVTNVLEKPLDREKNAFHQLLLTALDGGTPVTSGTCKITITVLDNNDNFPVFSENEYKVVLKENITTGTFLVKLTATDADDGLNGEVRYSFGSRTPDSVLSTFAINEVEDGKAVPELVLEKPLDREKKAIHQLLLTALDGGNPVLSGTSQITITVLDVNDNFPMFEKNTYKVSLQENTAQNTFVVKIAATDADEGPNGEVEFSFGSRTPDSVLSLFEINPLTGEIHLKGDLDYEKASSYKIEITARDKGVPEMESHCRLQIDIVDVNDNTPEIVLTSEPQPVREDAASGFFYTVSILVMALYAGLCR